MSWLRTNEEGWPIFWRGTRIRQSWLGYYVLRIALWIDGVKPAPPALVTNSDGKEGWRCPPPTPSKLAQQAAEQIVKMLESAIDRLDDGDPAVDLLRVSDVQPIISSVIEPLERERQECIEILWKELDRDRGDETLRQLCMIAANGLYWRQKAMEAAEASLASLSQERDSYKKQALDAADYQLNVLAPKHVKLLERAESAESRLSSLSEAVGMLMPYLRHKAICSAGTSVIHNMGKPNERREPYKCDCGFRAAADKCRALGVGK